MYLGLPDLHRPAKSLDSQIPGPQITVQITYLLGLLVMASLQKSTKKVGYLGLRYTINHIGDPTGYLHSLDRVG